MNSSKQIDVNFLHECFSYDADTGNIYWKFRPSSHFKNESACQNWNNRYAGNKAGTVDAKGYRVIKLLGTPHKAHRIIWALSHGQYPEGFIDHINGMTDDNRIGNLRVVDFVTNAQN
ncbi:HNH endonuclease signature motif containing protein [Klebsiella pneumoniae]